MQLESETETDLDPLPEVDISLLVVKPARFIEEETIPNPEKE